MNIRKRFNKPVILINFKYFYFRHIRSSIKNYFYPRVQMQSYNKSDFVTKIYPFTQVSLFPNKVRAKVNRKNRTILQFIGER